MFNPWAERGSWRSAESRSLASLTLNAVQCNRLQSQICFPKLRAQEGDGRDGHLRIAFYELQSCLLGQ
jgi:hypothetical protein